MARLSRICFTNVNYGLTDFELLHDCNQKSNIKMATTSIGVKDVNQYEFVIAYGTFLKKSGKLKVPEWVDIVKTAKFKELAPYDNDWYYTRCAAIARRVYIRSPVGVGALTKIFGGKKRNGTKPGHFCRGSSSVARKALQSLEDVKVLEKGPNGGRILSSQGRRDMDRIARQVGLTPELESTE